MTVITTAREYLIDMSRCESRGRLVAMEARQDGGHECVLDSTIFYPKGGGQPSDIGTISSGAFQFDVAAAEDREGTIVHIGTHTRGDPLTLGQMLDLHIDADARARHSALQSAGHLLVNAALAFDSALRPVKGYHFPEGPYVEFDGDIAPELRDTACDSIQKTVDALIVRDLPIRVHAASDALPEDVQTLLVPSANRAVRIVEIDGIGIPCGGTHVESTRSLSGLTVRGLKCKKGTTRVRYSLPNMAGDA